MYADRYVQRVPFLRLGDRAISRIVFKGSPGRNKETEGRKGKKRRPPSPSVESLTFRGEQQIDEGQKVSIMHGSGKKRGNKAGTLAPCLSYLVSLRLLSATEEFARETFDSFHK